MEKTSRTSKLRKKRRKPLGLYERNPWPVHSASTQSLSDVYHLDCFVFQKNAVVVSDLRQTLALLAKEERLSYTVCSTNRCYYRGRKEHNRNHLEGKV